MKRRVAYALIALAVVFGLGVIACMIGTIWFTGNGDDLNANLADTGFLCFLLADIAGGAGAILLISWDD